MGQQILGTPKFRAFSLQNQGINRYLQISTQGINRSNLFKTPKILKIQTYSLRYHHWRRLLQILKCMCSKNVFVDTHINTYLCEVFKSIHNRRNHVLVSLNLHSITALTEDEKLFRIYFIMMLVLFVICTLYISEIFQRISWHLKHFYVTKRRSNNFHPHRI